MVTRISLTVSALRGYTHRLNMRTTNIRDVTYLRIFTNIKTGYEYYNLILVFFLIYFMEQQSQSYSTKQIIVCYCLEIVN